MNEWADVPDTGKTDGKNLIGYDPVGKRLLWYTVNNMGTTHEHIVRWTSDKPYLSKHGMVRNSQPLKPFFKKK
jgi:hypothetical protein